MEEVESKRYEIECVYFTRRQDKRGRPVYYCTLMEQEEPYCTMCQFARYPSDPGEEGMRTN